MSGNKATKNGGGIYLGLSGTLLILLQQHNMKEEHILYQLADATLGEQGARLLERLARA